MPDDFRAGAITARQARILNDLVRTAGQFDRLTVAPPLALSRRAGIPNITADFAVPVLAEITGNDAATPPIHTAKRKTRSGTGTVIDYPTLTTYASVLNPAASAIATGTLVELVPIPEYPDSYWAFPTSGGITSAESGLVGNFALTGGLQDTGLSITIPAAGTYFVYGRVTAFFSAGFTAGTYARVYAQIQQGATVFGSSIATVVNSTDGTSSGTAAGTAPIGFRSVFVGGEVLKLWAARVSNDAGVSWSLSSLVANGSTGIGGTHLGHLKLA